MNRALFAPARANSRPVILDENGEPVMYADTADISDLYAAEGLLELSEVLRRFSLERAPNSLARASKQSEARVTEGD